MHLSRFIATRLALGKHKTFASLIIRLAWFGVGLSVAVMLIALAIVVGYKQQITKKLQVLVDILKYILLVQVEIMTMSNLRIQVVW